MAHRTRLDRADTANAPRPSSTLGEAPRSSLDTVATAPSNSLSRRLKRYPAAVTIARLPLVRAARREGRKFARLPAVRGARRRAGRLASRLGLRPTPVPAPKPATAATTPPAKVYPSARAQRPIGIFYDELSRGVNPFSLIETHGVADVTDPPEVIADLFNRFGIVKVRRVYSPTRSRELNEHCIDFSGLKPLDFRDVFSKQKKWGTGGAPVLNDRRFWPYVVEPKITEILDLLIGTNTFEFGSAVAAHYSARGLHRDYRMLVEEDATPYSVKHPDERIIRILHYCGINGGSLGFIPFSHDEARFTEQAHRVGLDHPTEWFDRHRQVLTQARLQRDFVEADEIERHVCWVQADPGDIVVSNSAMLHCGDYLTGPRYFFVTTYAASRPEVVEIAAKNATTALSEEYYTYLHDKGLLGSADVIAKAQANRAAA